MITQAEKILLHNQRVVENPSKSLKQIYINPSHINPILDRLPSNFSGTVCDLGSGQGFLGICASYRFSDLKVTFVDIDKNALDKIPSFIGERVCADILNYSPKKLFDATFSRAVLHCFNKEDNFKVIKKAIDITNPKGIVIFSLLFAFDYNQQRVINNFYNFLSLVLKTPSIDRHILTLNELGLISNSFKKNFSIYRSSNNNIEFNHLNISKRFNLKKSESVQIESYLQKEYKKFSHFFKKDKKGNLTLMIPSCELVIKI